MISRTIGMPELGLIAGTRTALGVGIGLLIADRLAPDRRRAVGWTLFALGALSTIPLAADVVLRHKPVDSGSGNHVHGSHEEAEETVMHDT